MTAMTPKEMLAKLVAFDTVSRNSNMALIGFVADYLHGHGIDARIIPNEDRSTDTSGVLPGSSAVRRARAISPARW